MTAPAYRFDVTGMKCEGCVAAAKEAIEKIPGVTQAEVDLATASAIVHGHPDPDAVAQALTQAGYPAKLSGST